MKKQKISLLFIGITVIFLATLSYCSKTYYNEKTKQSASTPLLFAGVPVWNEMEHGVRGFQDKFMITKAYHTSDIISLFALTPDEITKNTLIYIDEAKNAINEIIALPDNERNFANTAKALDDVCSLSNLATAHRIYEALELLSPDDAVRNAAHDACIIFQSFWVDNITSNKALYNAFMAYVLQIDETENLSAQQHYFINDTVDSFKRAGLSLDDATLAIATALRKELAQLTSDFDRNIAQDNSTIAVKLEELAGLDDDFIATLPRTDDGLYTVGIDYPTYFRIMENCCVAETRKKLYIVFNNRAYPTNDHLLQLIITKRNELAQLLGYTDFAHYDISDQMASTPEKAEQFINDLVHKSVEKITAEIATLTQQLPDSVELTPDGKINPWDFPYIENNYKKTTFNIDEQKIAEYFPMQNTVDELLDIYRQFFSIDFQEVPGDGLWHEDVSIVRVTNKAGDELLGTLILDLHPRPNKYSHAAHSTIIPATYTPDGKRIPDVSVVMANFSKPTATQPSLLKRSEVQTFFHEFGHALHAILGATEIGSLSGTHTKRDFVELPSQMLEEWLTDKDILKKVSCHYQTGEPLPDDIISTIISLKNLTSGFFVTRQANLALIALAMFGPENNKNPHLIIQRLYEKVLPQIAFADENHFYASFGHLTGYGAKYYGYLWSKVFALDIFAEIKKSGLLNPTVGQRYIANVLSKGGAQNPNELLYNFLGRTPNAHEFFMDMGLDTIRIQI